MARRLNTRFVFVSMLVLGGILAAGGGAYWYHKRHRDPKQLLTIAETGEREGKYRDAAEHYAGAGQLMHDPKLMTQAGDLLYKVAYDDDENLLDARRYWDAAVSMDPSYTPALSHHL